jgi:hypothetical protein
MMEEKNLEQRKQDMENVRASAADPVGSKMMMLFPYRVIGDPLRQESRWAHSDPTPSAGLDLHTRAGQLT